MKLVLPSSLVTVMSLTVSTPPAVITRLNQAIHKAMQNPEFKRKVEESGGTLVPTTPEEFTVQIQQAMARYARVAKAAKISMN